jgi:hypothetical protein
LKLIFNGENEELTPSFLKVGNWSEGISYEADGLHMGDSIALSNEKPAINKTLVITTNMVKIT